MGRSGVLSKTHFYVFKKPKKYINAMETLPFTKISSIYLPSNKEKVFIIIDKNRHEYHFKIEDNRKWANIIKEHCDDIAITTTPPTPSATNDATNEIQENIDGIAIETDLFPAIILNYNTNPTPTTDTEIDHDSMTNIENYDAQIIEEVDLFIIDLVNGFLRECRSKSTRKNQKSLPEIQNLCTLFYFIRKFDTRRLRRECD